VTINLAFAAARRPGVISNRESARKKQKSVRLSGSREKIGPGSLLDVLHPIVFRIETAREGRVRIDQQPHAIRSRSLVASARMMSGGQGQRSVPRAIVLRIVTARGALGPTAPQSRATQSRNLVAIDGMTSDRKKQQDASRVIVSRIASEREDRDQMVRQNRATRNRNLVVIEEITSGRDQRGAPNFRDERTADRTASESQDSKVNAVLQGMAVHLSLSIGRAKEKVPAKENSEDALNDLLLRNRSDSLHAASVQGVGGDFRDREIRNAETTDPRDLPLVISALPSEEIAAAVPDTLSSSLTRF
jgi:hypothetical protein